MARGEPSSKAIDRTHTNTIHNLLACFEPRGEHMDAAAAAMVAGCIRAAAKPRVEPLAAALSSDGNAPGRRRRSWWDPETTATRRGRLGDRKFVDSIIGGNEKEQEAAGRFQRSYRSDLKVEQMRSHIGRHVQDTISLNHETFCYLRQ